MNALARHFLDGDNVRALDAPARLDHLLETPGIVLHQHVREQQRERLVPHQLARAPHGVSETERQLLTGEACGAGHRQVARQRLEIRMPLALDQCVLEFELPVEVILDHALVAAGDEDEMLDAGLARLVNDVLDQRPIEHRQHFLGHRLGRGEEPGAQPGHGKNGFADGFHGLR